MEAMRVEICLGDAGTGAWAHLRFGPAYVGAAMHKFRRERDRHFVRKPEHVQIDIESRRTLHRSSF